MKAVHVKVGPAEAQPANWPVGTPFIYQSSLWRINGLYLATARSGEREVWWILAERPSENWTSDGEDGQ
jgi:hypothetical protein